MNENKSNFNPFEKQIKKQPGKTANQKPQIPISNRYCADLTNQPPNEENKLENQKPPQKYKIPPKRPSPSTKEIEDKPSNQPKDNAENKLAEDIFGLEAKEPEAPSNLANLFGEVKLTDRVNKNQQSNGNEDGLVNEVLEEKKEEPEPFEKVENIKDNNVDLFFEITENINKHQPNTEVNINQQIESEDDKDKEKTKEKDPNEHNEPVEIQSSPKTTESKEINSEVDKIKEDNKELNGNGNESEEKAKEENKDKASANDHCISQIDQNNSRGHNLNPNANQYHYIDQQGKAFNEGFDTHQYISLRRECNELKASLNGLKALNQSLVNEVALYKNENKNQQAFINQYKKKELNEGEMVLRKQIEMLKHEMETKERINQSLIEENKRLNSSIERFKAIAEDFSYTSKETIELPPIELDINDLNCYEERTTTQEQINELKNKESNKENSEKRPVPDINENQELNKPKVYQNTSNDSQEDNTHSKRIVDQPNPVSTSVNSDETIAKESKNQTSPMNQNPSNSNANEQIKTENPFEGNPQDDEPTSFEKITKKTKSEVVSKGKPFDKPFAKPTPPSISKKPITKSQTQQVNIDEGEVDSLFQTSGDKTQNRIFD